MFSYILYNVVFLRVHLQLKYTVIHVYVYVHTSWTLFFHVYVCFSLTECVWCWTEGCIRTWSSHNSRLPEDVLKGIARTNSDLWTVQRVDASCRVNNKMIFLSSSISPLPPLFISLPPPLPSYTPLTAYFSPNSVGDEIERLHLLKMLVNKLPKANADNLK